MQSVWERSFSMLYKTTRIPLCVAQGGRPVFVCPQLDMPLFTEEFVRYCQLDFAIQKCEKTHPLLLYLHPGFFLGVAQPEEGQYLIYGPAIPYEHPPESIKHHLDAPIYDSNREALYNILLTTTPRSSSEFLNAFSLALYLFNKTEIDVGAMQMENPGTALPSTEGGMAYYLFETREEFSFHTPPSLEAGASEAIENGDVDALKRLMDMPISGRLGVLSLDRERQTRYMFVTFAGVIARAAMRGGLSYEMACSTADIYCQKMDQIKNMPEIEALRSRMMYDFCGQVARAKQRKELSYHVRACCEMIQRRLHEKMSLACLAESCGLSPNYLSQKFAAETGMSVVDYVNREKMKEASRLLRHTSFGISEISNYLGYSSQSYFTCIFKKEYGLTPHRYRQKYQSAA